MFFEEVQVLASYKWSGSYLLKVYTKIELDFFSGWQANFSAIKTLIREFPITFLTAGGLYSWFCLGVFVSFLLLSTKFFMQVWVIHMPWSYWSHPDFAISDMGSDTVDCSRNCESENSQAHQNISHKAENLLMYLCS